MQWRLAVSVKGDSAKIDASYMSLLAQRGQLLILRAKREYYLVVAATRWGVLACGPSLRTLDSKHFAKITEGTVRQGCVFLSVQDPADFRAAPLSVMTPCDAPALVDKLGAGITLQTGSANTLLKTSALSGFRGVPVHSLKRMMVDLDVLWSGARPRAEIGLVDALVRF